VVPAYDVLIVGRGGGSIEDLWSFNEEVVARAIASSKIPVISAVGHEIDVTIADFVADLRAPTPSAAAELVVQNATEICSRVDKLQKSMFQLTRVRIQNLKLQVTRYARHLIDPKKKLEESKFRCRELWNRIARLTTQNIESRKQDLDLLGVRLQQDMEGRITESNHYLKRLMGLLGSLSPLGVVDRGYSITSKNGKIIKNVTELQAGDLVDVRLAKGQFSAEVKETRK
jgi:exodeoxyribonuclease VII large subunit